MNVQQVLQKLAQKDPSLTFRYDDDLGVVKQLRGQFVKAQPDAKAVQAAGLEFIRSYKELFGDIDFSHITSLNEARDRQGGFNVTLQQFHGKHRVLGGSIRFHADKEGRLDAVNNRLLPHLDKLPMDARISADEAVQAARRKCRIEGEPLQPPELIVHRHEGSLRLAWHLLMSDTKPGIHGAPAQMAVFVDAIDGDVYFFYDNIQTAGPIIGTGTGHYSGGGPLQAWFDNTTNLLRDTTRVGMGGAEISTNDEDGTSPSSDMDSNWNDLSTSPRDQNQGAEVDAHRFAAAVYDYFNTIHGRNSFDGAGGTLMTDVHYGTNFNNGYWNGTQVYLGDGDGINWDYMCSDDWLAHEFTHAYTQHTCGLIYYAESGALNEAFSDVFAAFITGDWLVFEDSWLQATAPAARNMIDPTNGGNWDNSSEAAAQASTFAGHQPSHYNNRYTGTWDNAGVHINSGVINHLFYLLTVGGTHAISGVTVNGVGQSPAEMLLWQCLSVNLVGNPNASFLEFREAMMDACLDLFPTDLNLLTQVKAAFNAVGIGPDTYLRDNLSDTGVEPFGGSYLWASPDVINRQTLSANPVLEFADLNNDALWQNVEAGQDNYVYLRVGNRGNQSGDVTINVYFIPASSFGIPAGWLHIGTLVETGIAPGSVRISGPLTFPQALIPAPGHYCMIGVVSSGVDPAPDHTLIASVSDYINFVSNTNNIAYRNMNVVDLLPGVPGVANVQVQPMPGLRERFDLRLDAGRFMPGARLRIRGPAKPLDGARARGLRLIAREGEENIYELMPARQRLQRRLFLESNQSIVGFDQVLVEEPFELRVEWVLPKDAVILRQVLKAGYRIGWRQRWQDKDVGAAYINLRRPQQGGEREILVDVKPQRKAKPPVHH
jgi:thermolysin